MRLLAVKHEREQCRFQSLQLFNEEINIFNEETLNVNRNFAYKKTPLFGTVSL